jgi:PD-(D/E)XK nuclease superfamily
MYEVLLAYALRERGSSVERQKPIPVCFRGKRSDEGFRADLGCWNSSGRVEIRRVLRPRPQEAGSYLFETFSP